MESVELSLEAGEIHVRLGHYDMIKWACPECGAGCKLYDHQPSGDGVTWTPANNIGRFCTRCRREANAANTGCVW